MNDHSTVRAALSNTPDTHTRDGGEEGGEEEDRKVELSVCESALALEKPTC